MTVNVDFLGQGKAEGAVAQRLLSLGRLDPGQMRPYIGKDGRSYVTAHVGDDPSNPANYRVLPITANATLRRDEWIQLDEALLAISEQRLGGIQDLISAGLVFALGNAMGTTVLEYHDVSDAMAAELTMDGITRAQGDRPVYQTNYLPLPIIHVDYEINARVLAASRSLGNPLDTTSAERAARKVNEKLEEMLFTATTPAYQFAQGTIYGYLDHPDRNTVALTTNWDASAKTPAQILADVIALKQASIDAFHYGPWMLYIPTSYETVLDEDYDTQTPQTTIRERLVKISGITDVRIIDKLTADNVVLVQMTSDVVRLVQGLGIQNVEWMTEGQMLTKFKVMTIQVPQIRSDQAGNSGIVHLS